MSLKKKIATRARELGKQQLLSELGCIIESKKRVGPNTHRMKCLFDTAGLGLIETSASQIDINGEVNLEIIEAFDGLIPLDDTGNGSILTNLKGKKRKHDAFRFNKAGLDHRGFEYKDKQGNKWQIPLEKENKTYNTKFIIKPKAGHDYWCRISAGFGGSKSGIGQKINCDSREQRKRHSIL